MTLLPFLISLLFCVVSATSTTNITTVLKVSTLESFYGGNPNNVAGQAIWTSVLTSGDAASYTANQINMRVCCPNCHYLTSLRLSLDHYTQLVDFTYSEFNTTTLCLNAYATLIGSISIDLVTSGDLNNTIIYAIDDHGSAYIRLHPNAIEEVQELVEITNTPPEIDGVPAPIAPAPFTLDQFKTLFVNDTHTTIGFTDNSTRDFELSYGVLQQIIAVNQSSFTLSFVDIFTTLLAIRGYTVNVVGVVAYSNWTLIDIPFRPDITRFPALTTDCNYQGIVVQTDATHLAYHYQDFNMIFYRDNITTTSENILWGSTYHNSYLNGPVNITNFTLRVQGTGVSNPLLLSQWSEYKNQSDVIYWKTTPAPQVWLEFENDSLYDWFNNKTTAFVTNATLEYKHTQDPNEYRMNGHLYSISNGTDLAIHLPDSRLYNNKSFSIVFWTYVDNPNTNYTLLDATDFKITINDQALVVIWNYIAPISYHLTRLNTWYQIGIDRHDNSTVDIYFEGQFTHTFNFYNFSILSNPLVSILGGPIDNLVIFTNQTIGPLYMAALYEFYGFPYLSSFNVNVSNSTEFIDYVPQTTVNTCSSGSFYNTTIGSCQSCSPGFYQPFNLSTASSCIGCSVGTYMASFNGSSCISCPAGRFQSNSNASTPCNLCSIGTYAPSVGSSSCITCPIGSYQNNTGATACIACLAGTFSNSTTECTSCLPGTFQSNSSSATCTSCPPGTFQSNNGATSCMPCASGTYSSSNGSTSCIDCTAGTYSGAAMSTSCSVCNIGYYTNNNQSIDCVPCLPGSFANATGSTICMACTSGYATSQTNSSSCELCIPGYYSNGTGSSTCSPCIAGTYSSSNGSTSCMGCNPGYYSMGSGNSICNPCNPGSCSNSSNTITCTLCPTGTYQPNYNSTSCVNCPSGSYTNQTNSTSCMLCPPGSYSATPGSSNCTSCIAGTYQPSYNSTSCIDCNAGFYQSSSGSYSCTGCSPGSFNNGTGVSVCSACSSGFYQPSYNSTSCSSCPAGNYTNQTSSISCPTCSAGTFSSSQGSSICTNCQSGKYSNTTGSTQCTDCPVNTFSNTTGLTSCYSCPFATQTTTNGSTNCDPIIPSAVTGFNNIQSNPSLLSWNTVTYADLYAVQYNGNPVSTTSSLSYTIPSYNSSLVYSTIIQPMVTATGAAGPLTYQTIPASPASVSFVIDRTTNNVNVTWTQGPNTFAAIGNWIIYWSYNTTNTTTTTTKQLVASSVFYYSWFNLTTNTVLTWWMQTISVNGTYSGNTTSQSVTAYAIVPTDAYMQLKLTSDMRDTSVTNWQSTTQGSIPLTFTTVGGIQSVSFSSNFMATWQAITIPAASMPKSFTVAIWCNVNGGLNGSPYWGNTGNTGGSTTTPNAFILTEGAMYLVSAANSYLFTLSVPTWAVGTVWQHLTVTYDAATTTLSVYVNAVLIASGSDSRFLNNYNGGLSFTLGSQSTTTRPMTANYYDLYIYSRALSVNEINALMNVPMAQIYAPVGCSLSLDPSLTSVNATINTTPNTNMNYTSNQKIIVPAGNRADFHDFICPSGTTTNDDVIGYSYDYTCIQDATTKSYYWSTYLQHCYPIGLSFCYAGSGPQAGTSLVNVSCEANPLLTPSIPTPNVQITFEGQITDTSPNTYPLTVNNGFALSYDSSRGAVGRMSNSNTKQNVQVGGGFTVGSSYTIMAYVSFIYNISPNTGKAVIWGNQGGSGFTSTLDNSFYLSTFGATGVQVGQYVNGTLITINTSGRDYAATGIPWTHYTVTFNKATGTLTLFRNGQRYTTNSGTPNSMLVSAAHQSAFVGGLGIEIGCDTTATSAVSGIDQFQVWNSVLTDAQIHRAWKNSVKPIIPVSLPTLLAVTSVFNTISTPSVVQWTAPVPQNGDYYNVTYSSYSGASTLVTSTTSLNTIDTTTTSVTLPGYNPDYWYLLNVASASYYGTFSSIVTSIVPSRPTSVVVSGTTSTSITFSWTPQYTGTIIGYYLYATGDVNSIITTASTDTTYTYNSLTSGNTINLVIQTIGASSLTFSGNTTSVQGIAS